MPDEQPSDLEADIARLAHQFWEEEGCPEDRSVQHWERAQRELRERYGNSVADGQSPGGIPNDTGSSGKMG